MKEHIWAMVVVGLDGITPTIVAGCPLVASLLRTSPQTEEEVERALNSAEQLLEALALEDPPGEGLWVREGTIEPQRAIRLGALAHSERPGPGTLRYYKWRSRQANEDRETAQQLAHHLEARLKRVRRPTPGEVSACRRGRVTRCDLTSGFDRDCCLIEGAWRRPTPEEVSRWLVSALKPEAWTLRYIPAQPASAGGEA